MGKVKEFAMTHAECPVCGRCFLPWETKSGITCGRPECDDEADQLFEEIADNNNKGEQNGRSNERGTKTGIRGNGDITDSNA